MTKNILAAPLMATAALIFMCAPSNAQQAAPAVTSAATDPAIAQTALRTVITDLQSGQIDHSLFTTDLANRIHNQSEEIGSLLTQFGAIKTIRHIGPNQGGAMFRVEFENQDTDWVIAVNTDGQISALLFRPAQD